MSDLAATSSTVSIAVSKPGGECSSMADTSAMTPTQLLVAAEEAVVGIIDSIMLSQKVITNNAVMSISNNMQCNKL